MKTTVMLLLLAMIQTLGAHSAIAKGSPAPQQMDLEKPPGEPLSPEQQRLVLTRADELYASGKRRRASGIAVTIVGGLFTVGGAIALATVPHCPENSNGCVDFLEGLGQSIAGLAALGIGVPTTLIGSIIWASGSSRMGEAERMAGHSLALAPTAVTDGAQIGYGVALVGRF